MILCDAGVLLCIVDRTQSQHNTYKDALIGLAKPVITTWPCLTEAMYLALHRGGLDNAKPVGAASLRQAVDGLRYSGT